MSRSAQAGDNLFVGLDLGTSSLKGVAVTARGEVVAEAHAAYATSRDAAGQAEQDPAAWLRALRRVAGRLRETAPATRWRAIGLSGMIPTLVLVDAAGRPTGPAITWEDSRAGAEGETFREIAGDAFAGCGRSLGGLALYERTGQWVDGRYLLPMWMRLRHAEPERTASAVRLLSAKDYLFLRLTGVCATDPSTAAGFGCYDLVRGWSTCVADIAGVVADGSPGSRGAPALPPVCRPSTVHSLVPDMADRLSLPRGIPVCLGAADSVLGLLALGVSSSGDVACVTGTSTVIIGLGDEPVVDAEHRYLVTPLAREGAWGLEMDLLSTGSAVAWMSRLLHLGPDGERRLMELAAAEGRAGGEEAVVLPFFGGGEQGALWDPDLRGTVLGLELSHGPADLARGLVTGIVLETRRCLDVLEQNGLSRRPLRLAGAGASSPFFRRQLADATGRQVLLPREPVASFSALGAARLSAEAVGRVSAKDRSWSGALERVEPDASRREEWERRWARHRDAVERMRELYRTP